MIHGLSPAEDTQARILRPDYPVCRDRIIRSEDVGRIIRAGLLEKSGPYSDVARGGSSGRPDYPVLADRIIRSEVSASSVSSSSLPPLPCLVQLEGPCSEGSVGSYLMTQSMSE